MSATQLYTKGAFVWLPCPSNVWQKAQVAEGFGGNGNKLLVRKTSGEVQEIEITSLEDLPFLHNPDFLVAENDLTALSYLHEPAVLHSLRERFVNHNLIYTRCGIVLVAINPYQDLNIYDQDTVLAYRQGNQDSLDPHIFAVAEEAYSKLERESRDQSIIVSGESGAGKTVSAKYAMRYFATAGGSSAETQVEKKVLSSSPIMEAFGNAKTIRNDNSSRFGKFIELDFNVSCTIIGAHMRTYLLEKSRVVFQAPDERNYHMFYQLCAAADLPEMASLKLGPPEHFSYTNHGGNAYIDGVDDLKTFQETQRALSMLNFSDEEQAQMFSILSAILHLGNVAVLETDGEGSTIAKDDKHMEIVLDLLGLTGAFREQFRWWLVCRQIVSGKETFRKPLKANEAVFGRDALAKHIYAHLFQWIVRKMNRTLASSMKTHRFIGVLDIYGFETFDTNSFEQFCINFSNEKLQQQFNMHVFKLEQEEYVKEDLEWKFIDFYDNQPCIDLIENRLGILDLLDEECRFPQGNEKSWLNKLCENCKKYEHFEKPKRSNTAFMIRHFADNVQYEVNGFVEKNRDTVNEEQVNVLRSSSNPLLIALFEEEEINASAKADLRKIAGTTPRKGIGAAALKQIGPGSTSTLRKMKRTVGSQFKESLAQLMVTLNSTAPYYVRCVKPNDVKTAFEFDPNRVVQQLRACGVLETVRISAAGFPSRMTYEYFIQRYHLLIKSQGNERNARKMCEKIVNTILSDMDKFKFGRTKIFFRAGQVAFFEKLRTDILHRSSVILQKTIRGWFHRKRYVALRSATVKFQARCRGVLARKEAHSIRRTRAAITIQRHVRGWLARSKFLRMRVIVIQLQARVRGYLARKAYLKQICVRKAIIIQKNVRMWFAVKRYKKMRSDIIIVQSCVRRWLARREFKKLKTEARSIEHVKHLNVGLEIKIMTLQERLDEANKECKALRKVEEEYQEIKVRHERSIRAETDLKAAQIQIEHMNERITSLEADLRKMKETEVDLVNALEEGKKREDGLLKKIAEMQVNINDLEEKLKVKAEENNQTVRDSLEAERREILREKDVDAAHHQQLVQENEVLKERLEELEEHLTRFIEREKESSAFGSENSGEYEDDNGYDSKPPSMGKVEGSPETTGAHAMGSEEFALVLKLRSRNQYLQNECESYRQRIDKWVERDQEQQAGSMRLQELEMSNSKLLRDLNNLRESVCLSDMHAQKTMLSQFAGMQDELERRREESMQLRLILSNESVTKSTQAAPLFADADEDGWVSAFNAQKGIMRSMETGHQNEKQRWREEEARLRDVIDRQLFEIEERCAYIGAPVGTAEGIVRRDYQYLMNENVELREKYDEAVAHIRKLQKQMKALKQNGATSAASGMSSSMQAEPSSLSSLNAFRNAAVVKKSTAEIDGVLEHKKELQADLPKRIIFGFTPEMASQCLPGTAAYLLFMAIRYTDMINDEVGTRSIISAAINSVKRVLKSNPKKIDYWLLWMANVSRLLHCMKQYSGEESFKRENTARQNDQCLKNFDLTAFRPPISDTASWIYINTIKMMEERISNLVYPAIIQLDSIPVSTVPISRTRSESKHFDKSIDPLVASKLLVTELDHFLSLCSRYGVDPPLVTQIFRQLYYYISAEALNSLLLRKEMCNWSRGIQIRFNVTRLEQWVRENKVQDGDKTAPILDTLLPIIQASQLLQARKRVEDAEAFVATVDKLTAPQIVKLLNLYTTQGDYEEKVQPEFMKRVQERLIETRPEEERSAHTLADTKFSFSVRMPFCPSSITLESVEVPQQLDIPANKA